MAARGRGKADPFGDVRADVRGGELKPIYVLFGPEPHLQRQAYDLLFAAAVAGGPRGFNEQVFEGGSASGDAIAGAAQHLPMMASRRVIVVRNAAKLNAESQARLAEYCSNPSPTTVLIFLGADGAKKVFDGRQKLAKAIKKHGRWCEFRKLYGRNLSSWIEAEADALGKALERGGASLFEDLMGNDLAQIANGLRHAALFVGDDSDRISVEDLQQVLVGRNTEALWGLLDAVGQRRRESALRCLQLLWGQGQTPFSVYNLVARRVRQLLAAERAIAHGSSGDDALRAAGVAPNMLWKWRDQLGRYRLGELQRASSRMLAAESALKGGYRIDPKWSVETAIADVIGR